MIKKQNPANIVSSLGDRYIAFAERLSEGTGIIAAYLLVPLVIVFLIEIIARNLFNHPTTWAYGTCFIIGGCAAVLGFAYALKNGVMVRIDVIHSKLGEKAKCIIDMLMCLVLLFPLTVGGSYQCIKYAVLSVQASETISVGSWNAPIWPTKIVIALSCIVLTMQTFAEMIKLIKKLKTLHREAKS